MKNFILSLLYIILKFFDKFTGNLLFPALFEKFQENAYISKKINNIKTNFFIPNKITKWRVETLEKEEPETLEWIKSFNHKEKIIFWDIGANIGLYSIYAATLHKNIEVVSFEPSTNNLRVLSRNVYINNLEQIIKINQMPLSDKVNEYATMNESEFIEGWSMATFRYENDFEGKELKPKQKYKIFGTSIDFLLDNKILEVPNYIKIDVDGIEHKILKGALNHLDNHSIKSLSIEINENFLEQTKAIKEIMETKGFKILQKKGLGPTSENVKFNKTFNYLFVRK